MDPSRVEFLLNLSVNRYRIKMVDASGAIQLFRNKPTSEGGSLLQREVTQIALFRSRPPSEEGDTDDLGS